MNFLQRLLAHKRRTGQPLRVSVVSLSYRQMPRNWRLDRPRPTGRRLRGHHNHTAKQQRDRKLRLSDLLPRLATAAAGVMEAVFMPTYLHQRELAKSQGRLEDFLLEGKRR